MKLMRWAVLITITAALAAPLSGCGKKPKELDPPDGGKSGYPRTYPTSR